MLACLSWVLGRTLIPPLSRGRTCGAQPLQLQIEYDLATDMLAHLCSPDPRGADYITGIYDALTWVAGKTAHLPL